jgi:hypothetical protein
MLRCSFGVEQMSTGEIEISFLCCFWGKANDQKKSESLFMDFCQFGFFHSYGAMEHSTTCQLKKRPDLCPLSRRIYVAD